MKRNGRRVVFVSSCPDGWGGCEELWAGAAHILRSRSHEIVALRTEPWPQRKVHERWAELAQAGIDIGTFGASPLSRTPPIIADLIGPLAGRASMRMRHLALAAKLRALEPDLVVVAQWGAYDGIFPICLPEVCQFAEVPYVLICQKASDIHWPADGLRHIYAQAYLKASAVFFVSAHNLRTVEQQLSVSFGAAEVIHNPFRLKVTAPLKWPEIKRGILKFACVGRLWALDKAQDVLLNVLARECWRGRPIEVNIFGEGDNARGIEAMAKWLNLTNVRFPGFADPTEIWRTHHALVLPTRAEGLPLVQVEAMMCGRPVIITDAGGSSEIMVDGQHGFLAAAAAEQPFAEALERAWQRRDEWPAIGLAAADHVRKLYRTDPCRDFADRLESFIIK